MKFGIDFHPLVKFDLAEAECWYQAIEPRLKERFLSELEAQFEALSDDALLYRPRFADIRRVNPPVFHHGVLLYRGRGVRRARRPVRGAR